MKIFENSNLRLLNLDDNRFIIQIYGPYPMFLTGNLDHKTSIKDNAKIFTEISIINESNKLLIVKDIEGKNYICFGEKGYEGVSREYDYIGNIGKHGEIVVNYIIKGHTMWGYVNKKNYKRNNFYLKKDKPYFLESKIGNYFVIGKEDFTNDKNKVWISGYYTKKRNKVWWNLKYQSVDYYSQIENAPSNFFVGIRETSPGNKIIELYKSKVDKENFEFPPPDSAPELYRDVEYDKVNKVFYVTQLNGLRSILFNDKDKGFIYWPETERRILKDYKFVGNILIGRKEDGCDSIIHKYKGDLSRLWTNVKGSENSITYIFDGKVFTTDYINLENAYEKTLKMINEKFEQTKTSKLTQRMEKNNTIYQDNIINKLDVDFIAISTWVDWYGEKELKVKNPLKVIDESQGSKIKEGYRVAIIHPNENKIYIGTIINLRLPRDYYILKVEKIKSIEPYKYNIDFNKGYYRVSLLCDIENPEKEIIELLTKKNFIKNTAGHSDMEELKKPDSKKVEFNKKIDETKINEVIEKESHFDVNSFRKLYKELSFYNFPESKIIKALEILLEETFQQEVWKVMIDEYAQTLKVEPDYNQIIEEIKENLTDEEADEFLHRYKMGLKYKKYGEMEAIKAACLNIKSDFGTTMDWVYPKLKPIIPKVNNYDFVSYLCENFVQIEEYIKLNDYTKGEDGIIINKIPLPQNYSINFENQEYKIGDKLSTKLIHEQRRIYVKKDPGALFIKIEDSEIIKDNPPFKYKIEGVGQGIQEFLPNNENQRILDSKEPLILIKENSQHEFIFYDIAVCDRYDKRETRNRKIIEFILRGIRTSD